jgi:pimeloyl-ACP methyl ester carboxylesterase
LYSAINKRLSYGASFSLVILSVWALGAAQPAGPPTEIGFFDSNGAKIRYAVAGEGEPVVLIHGWMADASMWGRDAKGNPKLNPPPGFRLIALDCRGHGQSDKLHDRALYGPEMAMDVIRLMDHLKIPKAQLVGYSMGAFIVGKIAATHPDRVISAVYGGQVPLVIGAPPSGSRETAVFAKAAEEGKGMGSYILEIFPPGRLKPTPEQANVLAEFMLKGKDAKALAAAGLSFDDLQVAEKDLAACPAPALFIYGSLESEHLKGRVEALRKALSRADVVVIEGSDHVTVLTRSAFGDSIREFLRKTSPAASSTKAGRTRGLIDP